MGLDVVDGFGREAGHRLRSGDDFGLALNARRGVANFVGTVIVDRETFDDGVRSVAFGQRVRQLLQNHNADAFTWDRTSRFRVKRAAMSIRRCDAAILKKIPPLLGKRDGNRARQRQVTLVVEKVLTRHTHCDEGRGTGRLDIQARSAQVEFVGHARWQIILVVGQHQLMLVELRNEFGAGEEILRKVGVHAHAGEHTDRAVKSRWIATGIFQRLPRAFEEDTMLRVKQVRFAWVQPEEAGVEQISSLENAARIDVIWPLFRSINSCGNQLLVGEEGNAFHAVAQITPKLVDVARVRKAPGHADNGKAVFSRGFGIHAITAALCFWPRLAAVCLRWPRSCVFPKEIGSRSPRKLANALTVGY